jgi:DNA-binding response OmpR family regulator
MRTMVLVEDDPLLARSFIRTFRRKYDITHFVRVSEAREYLKKNSPDVLLLDRQVTGDDGWSLRHDVNHTHTRVVLMTGNPPPGTTLTFFQKGVEDLQRLIDMVEGR